MTAISFPPFALFALGALALPLLKGKQRNLLTIAVPAVAFYLIYLLAPGTHLGLHFFGFDLTLLRVDKLSKIFGYIFTLNGFAAFIYAYYLKDSRQHISALFYMAGALGVVFAGDLLSLYFFWEIMAVASTFLILARETPASSSAGLRYVMVHLFGGLILLAGIVLQISQTGSIEFSSSILASRSVAAYLILGGILVNAAAPPLHAWLSDAYPESTVTGGVILSAYTTKTAVYTLIRGFPGYEVLIVVGCIMTVYGIIYALLENDMRRILAYSIINQVGFMVTGVGIGTAMALNGAAAHAFCHIIYKALLWMSAGSVLYMTGKSKCTELGGLYKTMPWTMILGTVGALAISSVPFTSGFTSKPMIIEASIHEHLTWVWLVLEVASAGVFLHAGIKFPYFVFFAKDRGLRPGEPPHKSMHLAMGLLAFLCIFLGVYPQPLYAILPFEMEFHSVYTLPHVMRQFQLLMFSALVFFLFLKLLKRTDTIALDTDWFYRKGGRLAYVATDRVFNTLNAVVNQAVVMTFVPAVSSRIKNGAYIVALMALRPVWALGGNNGRLLEEKKVELQSRMDTRTVPIGLTAAAAAILFIIIFLTSR